MCADLGRIRGVRGAAQGRVLILTECDCDLLPIHGGVRVTHVKTMAEAIRVHEAHYDAVYADPNNVEIRYWSIHLNGRHCTEGPG